MTGILMGFFLMAGGKMESVGDTFYCGSFTIKQEKDELLMAKEIFDNIPVNNKYTSFQCIVEGNLKRLARGFLYPSRLYGALEIMSNTCFTTRFFLDNGVINKA